jgi:hypothetical protein
MHRRHRTHHATGIPSWGSTPGWDQPLPGWNPLVDHGPRPVSDWHYRAGPHQHHE